MIKTTLAALVAIAAVSAAAPAFAEPDMHVVVKEAPSSTPYYDDNSVLDRLSQQGIKATSVENWGLLIRAYVRQADGTEVQKFFRRDNLAPVEL